MNDLISRQDAIDVISTRHVKVWTDEDGVFNDGLDAAMEEIKALPSAEKTGEWIRTKNPLNEEITICSECGTIIKQGYLDYCAKCGARMVGGTDE